MAGVPAPHTVDVIDALPTGNPAKPLAVVLDKDAASLQLEQEFGVGFHAMRLAPQRSPTRRVSINASPCSVWNDSASTFKSPRRSMAGGSPSLAVSWAPAAAALPLVEQERLLEVRQQQMKLAWADLVGQPHAATAAVSGPELSHLLQAVDGGSALASARSLDGHAAAVVDAAHHEPLGLHGPGAVRAIAGASGRVDARVRYGTPDGTPRSTTRGYLHARLVDTTGDSNAGNSGGSPNLPVLAYDESRGAISTPTATACDGLQGIHLDGAVPSTPRLRAPQVGYLAAALAMPSSVETSLKNTTTSSANAPIRATARVPAVAAGIDGENDSSINNSVSAPRQSTRSEFTHLDDTTGAIAPEVETRAVMHSTSAISADSILGTPHSDARNVSPQLPVPFDQASKEDGNASVLSSLPVQHDWIQSHPSSGGLDVSATEAAEVAVLQAAITQQRHLHLRWKARFESTVELPLRAVEDELTALLSQQNTAYTNCLYELGRAMSDNGVTSELTAFDSTRVHLLPHRAANDVNDIRGFTVGAGGMHANQHHASEAAAANARAAAAHRAAAILETHARSSAVTVARIRRLRALVAATVATVK